MFYKAIICAKNFFISKKLLYKLDMSIPVPNSETHCGKKHISFTFEVQNFSICF